jgi:hypothetical protein
MSPEPKTMKTAIPLAVAERNTEPSSEIAATMETPTASSSAGSTIRSGHQWPISPVTSISAV